MEEKQRFVSLAGSGHFTMTELCKQFGISRKTGHKWAARHAEGGMKGLEEHSRAPKSVTSRTCDAVERLICGEKRLHPTWGPTKIRRVISIKHGLETRPAEARPRVPRTLQVGAGERQRRGPLLFPDRG